MYRNMLVPLDGSELAEVTLPYAEHIAGHLNVNMHVLHICSPSESSFMCRSYVQHAAEMAEKESREVQATATGRGTVEAQAQVASGQPAEEILAYAQEKNVDFILMSTHGRSGISRWVLGSVAYKMLGASTVPVWLVRAGAEEKAYEYLKDFNILAPLDGSPASEAVLPHIETLAKQHTGGSVKVTVLKVCEPPDLLADYPESTMPHTWEEHVNLSSSHSRNTCSAYLVDVEQRLQKSGIAAESVVDLGDPAQVINDYQRRHPFNLIVMTTHGRSGSILGPIGSVAGKVLYAASAPVFMVRPPGGS